MTIDEKILRAKADYDAVYEAGKNAGGGGGQGSYDEGYEAGRKAEYDAFWDERQDYGKRTDYRFFWYQSASTRADPKYYIKADDASNIMTSSDIESVNWEKTNLSSVSSLYSAFAYSPIKSIDTDLGLSSSAVATSMNSIFRNATKLESVQKLTVLPILVFKDSFQNCTELVHIIFDGTVEQNGLNLQWSTKLSKASIESIMAALSTATNSLTVTLSKSAVDNAFTDDEWSALVSQHANWTISLI